MEIFEKVGLKTNTKKTKVLVFLAGQIRIAFSEEAYRAHIDRKYREERGSGMMECNLCNKALRTSLLPLHLET